MRQGIGRIVADCPDVTEMVVQALEFEKQTNTLAKRHRDVNLHQGFDGLTIGQAMADRGVAGHPLSEGHGIQEFFTLE